MAYDNPKYLAVERYLRKISGQEKEPEITSIDHNYAKAWSDHPDAVHTRPAKMLFMSGLSRYSSTLGSRKNDEEVDVVSCDDPLPSPFDNQKARLLMNETERTHRFIPSAEEEDKEGHILAWAANGKFLVKKSDWTTGQKKVFGEVMSILQRVKLAKLAYAGTYNEPIKRRIAIDKAAKRMRIKFCSFSWSMKVLCWLHKAIIEHANNSTICVYLDVMQAIKAKLPNLIDKMVSMQQMHPVGGNLVDVLSQMLKKPWDPVLPQLAQYKPKKLPSNPIILITPSAPNPHAFSQRMRFWSNNLGSLCKVMNVPVNLAAGANATFEDCLNQIINSVKNKIVELKTHYPGRPIILLGWMTGALIACHIALEEPVTAIICLGFPLTGVNGSRGDVEDPLLDCRVPTLFIVGQNACMCSLDDIEDFRARMKAETGLVVVGGADDFLRLCQLKISADCITQAMVDRCVVEEISDFLLWVLNMHLPATTSGAHASSSKASLREDDEEKQPQAAADESKRRRRKPREFSPEFSTPAKKRPRQYVPKKATSSSSKAKLSPITSDSSNSSEYLPEKSRSNKKTKKKKDKKRTSRASTGSWRKRPANPPVMKIDRPELKDEPVATTPSRGAASSTSKSNLFCKFLQQKNDPVDVEKAFGNDSRYLPRPITPTEMEDTVSAEETENVLSELEALANKEAKESKLSVTTFENITAQVGINTLATGQTTESCALTTATPSVVVASPTVETSSTTVATTVATVRTVFPSAKLITSMAQQNVKTSGNISIISGTTASGSLTSPTKSYLLTVPTGSSFLMASADGKPQPTKMIQVHKVMPKNLPTLNVKSPTLASLVTQASPSETPEQPRICNLSLLSDVAERAGSMPKKLDSTSPTATLVKLTASGEAKLNKATKCVKFITPGSSQPKVRSAPPVRMETPEEMVEKQLAIQALNNLDSPSTSAKETPYSVCYSKPESSLAARSAANPGYYMYVPPATGMGGARGRGRPRTVFPVPSLKKGRYFDM